MRCTPPPSGASSRISSPSCFAESLTDCHREYSKKLMLENPVIRTYAANARKLERLPPSPWARIPGSRARPRRGTNRSPWRANISSGYEASKSPAVAISRHTVWVVIIGRRSGLRFSSDISVSVRACCYAPSSLYYAIFRRRLPERTRRSHIKWLGHFIKSAIHQPYFDVVGVRMLNRRRAHGAKPKLFVHLVQWLDRIGDEQFGPSREQKDPRRVRQQLHQSASLISRIDNHAAEFPYVARQHVLEKRRRIQMAESQRRIREASRPERADQGRTPFLLARFDLIEAEVERERPQQHVHALLLDVQIAPGLAMKIGQLLESERGADRPHFEAAILLRVGALF